MYYQKMILWLCSLNGQKLFLLPTLKNELCPVKALTKLLNSYPSDNNAPLFQIYSMSQWSPLTDVRVRKHLKKVLHALNMQYFIITLHSFRRSGATFAFNHNVKIQNIKHHGTWTSDCVWRYVTSSADTGRQVASMFQQELC